MSETLLYFSFWKLFHSSILHALLTRELLFVSVCNRTYYGDVGKTYDLRVVKSVDTRLPFLCHLTFTANGQSHGDIVQVITEVPCWCPVINKHPHTHFTNSTNKACNPHKLSSILVHRENMSHFLRRSKNLLVMFVCLGMSIIYESNICTNLQ